MSRDSHRVLRAKGYITGERFFFGRRTPLRSARLYMYAYTLCGEEKKVSRDPFIYTYIYLFYVYRAARYRTR